MSSAFIAVCCIISICLQPALSSYLGYPRIHFAGQFRADTDTRNNDRCNYRPDKPVNPDTNDDWGVNGTNEFQFFDTAVTSVVYSTGVQSVDDAVVNRSIVGNLKRPFAKLTDLDVDCQDHSTIYGMNFGISWSNEFPTNDNETAFYGKWTHSVIAQRMWPRLKCYSPSNNNSELYQDSFPIAGQATTFITDLSWNSDILSESPALSELNGLAADKLSVRVTLVFYTRNYPPFISHNATLGYVYGVIGVPSPSDTLNIPGSRSMSNNGNVPDVTYDDPDDLCYDQDLSQYQPWTNEAPFEVDEVNMKVHVDLSNSIPSDIYNDLRNIGTLRLGVMSTSGGIGCVILLGDEDGIPYDSNEDLPFASAIYSFDISKGLSDNIADSNLVIVQMLNSSAGTPSTPVCETFSTGTSENVRILIEESTYFVRPYGYYVDRLDSLTQSSVIQTLYVTRYGVPVDGVNISVGIFNQLEPPLGPSLPENGVVTEESTLSTDSGGFVNFTFSLSDSVIIPAEREYAVPPCEDGFLPDNRTTLPIDGQVYYFSFCLTKSFSEGKCQDVTITFSFLAFSEIAYSRSPTWVTDVEPILTQYQRMAPIMDTILDMSNYDIVTKYHNIQLLRLALSQNIDDPSYMPTTRDLSPVKKQMILDWLDDPKYDDTSYESPDETVVCKEPDLHIITDTPEWPRCGGTKLPFNELPEVREALYRDLTDPYSVRSNFRTTKGRDMIKKQRPLFGKNSYNIRRRPSTFEVDDDDDDECTLSNVQAQLQTAVQLEWATIPTYMTSLYSIKFSEGYNLEVYNLIRSIIVQEMLHMTLAGNILIAIGGSVTIDSAETTPSYPTRLPGGVLPGLIVTLRKLSLEHVHDVFMGIELPTYTTVGGVINATGLHTIGSFYGEIHDCINELGDGIFTGDPEDQVVWPWEMSNSTGRLFPITNVTSAHEAIEEIKSQGEGATAVDPDQIATGKIAHFFKFEEIVCEKHLIDEGDETYSYSGAAIGFNPSGVWAMRDDPSSYGILPHTNCYTESRVFHQAYRAFLNKLQRVFSGHPDEISTAVEMMESLQVHAKKLMWTRYRPDNDKDVTTCGPVFDYEWRGPVCDESF